MTLAGHSEMILWIAGLSLAAFVLSILILPLIIIRLPTDYFSSKVPEQRRLSPLRLLLKVLKNALGILFVFAGFIMLFIPGQGILTMLLGISLTDFPGKRRLEAKIVSMPRVYRSLNWLRNKAERHPFILPKN